jgi:hypothetical protein
LLQPKRQSGAVNNRLPIIIIGTAVGLVSCWKIRIFRGFSCIDRLDSLPIFDGVIDLRAIFDREQWISTAGCAILNFDANAQKRVIFVQRNGFSTDAP